MNYPPIRHLLALAAGVFGALVLADIGDALKLLAGAVMALAVALFL